MSSKVTFGQLRNLLKNAQTYSAGYMGAVCPFHDDSKPSLMVYPDGWFKCLACGVSGNFDKLYRKLLGWDASRVVREATSYAGPKLPHIDCIDDVEAVASEAHEALLKFDQLQWYLKNRGVDGRIEPCRLGWWDGWYTVPVYDAHHSFQGMMLRANSTIQQATGNRFTHPEGQRSLMYCPDWQLYHKSKRLAIVFGMFDALALSDLRFPVVTTTSGKDSFKPEWLDDYRRPIVIFPDEGEYSSAMVLAGKLGWRASVYKMDYPEGVKDPCGYLETDRRSELATILGSALGDM